MAPAAPRAGGGIAFDAVTVAYRGAVALDALTLAVEPGEIMAIIGPSGCGKTTALRSVAGFVRPTSGRVRIGNADITDMPPHARDIGMVVQNYALFPHMRVDQNVAFGLHARRLANGEIAGRVAACLAMVGMSAFAARYPKQLSGGQQQRIAIARALAIRPRVLLLDEPLSALDAQIRLGMLGELQRLHRDLPDLTVLYVTHDQTEALLLADRIAIMRGGRLVATGASQALYRAPPNRFAAEFLGRANLVPVAIEQVDGPLARVRIGLEAVLARAPAAPIEPGRALLCVRPHDLALQQGDGLPSNAMNATVTSVQWQGDSHAIDVRVGGHPMRLVCTPLRAPPPEGASIAVHFAAHDATLIADAA